MGQTSKIIVGAVVLGLVTAVMVYIYVGRLVEQKPDSQSIKLAQVVLATKDLTPRTVISPDMVKLAEMPVNNIHPKAAISIAQVNGRVVKSSILAGEPVLTDRLVPAGEIPSLAFSIPLHHRAVTISVDEVVGVAGFIQPGDRVDVLGSIENKDHEVVSVVVLQNIEVLAIAQTMESDVDAKPRIVATVTLAVTLEEAQRLYIAETKGSLRLILRPTEARAQELTSIVTERDLLPRSQTSLHQTVKATRQVQTTKPQENYKVVEVIRGTQIESVTIRKQPY